MTTDTTHGHDEGRRWRRGLSPLLAAARTNEAALHAFYDATAPRLTTALSSVREAEQVDMVLVRTYQQVWCATSRTVPAFADDAAVEDWLLRRALVELARVQRSAQRHEVGAPSDDDS